MVLPAYTTADPVTSTTATVVEQALKNKETRIIYKNLLKSNNRLKKTSIWLLIEIKSKMERSG